jgi:hypothetical protein
MLEVLEAVAFVDDDQPKEILRNAFEQRFTTVISIE